MAFANLFYTKNNFLIHYKMNNYVLNNFSKLRWSIFFLPVLLLLIIFLFLYSQNALTVNAYIQIQKSWFYYLNGRLSQFPDLEYNLTQMGDAFIALSIVSAFIIYAPKIWESLITASLLSAVLSAVLKHLFHVPRPAATFNHQSFVIVGKTLSSTNNSLPSGHSITIFTVLTVLMFGFMPQQKINKVLWFALFILSGLFLAFTRVGVGAHYPMDIIIGGIVGYIAALSGIFIDRKYNIWKWINSKKSYLFFILLFAVCIALLIQLILKENLFIFYFSLLCLMYSMYAVTKAYFGK